MNRIRQFRTERRWSMDELCRRSGVSRGHLWEIESGKRSPLIATAWRIARAFGVSISDLFPDDEQAASYDDPSGCIVA